MPTSTDRAGAGERESMSVCKVDGCPEDAKIRGYCTKHYFLARGKGEIPTYKDGKEIPVCSVDGCNTPVYANGMCRMHRTRLLKTGTTDGGRCHPGGPCQAPGCDRQAKTKGYCAKHYQRLRLNGTLEMRKRRLNTEFAENMRNKHIVMMREEGATLPEIADMFSVSRQRIDQICKRHRERYNTTLNENNEYLG